MENNEKQNSISLYDLFLAFKKNWIIIAIAVILFSILGYGYGYKNTTTTYKATTKFVVAVEVNGNVNYSDSLRIINSYGEYVKDDVVLKEVVELNKDENLTVGGLKSKITSTVSSTSFFVTIDVVDVNKERAIKLANDVTSVVISHSLDSNNAISVLGASLVQTQEANDAITIKPNRMLYGLIGLAIGAVISLGYAFCHEFLSNKFKTKEEVEAATNTSVLGYFLEQKITKEDKERHVTHLVTAKELEPYNKLATNIRYSNIDHTYKVIEVTSTTKSELKTTTTINLAYSLVKNGKKVVVIDLDTRNPSIHKAFNLSKENGLVDYIDGEISKEDVIKHTEEGVDVVTFGKHMLNPMVAVESKEAQAFINELRETYDYVLIDTPPLAAYSDALAISKFVDGVIYNISLNLANKAAIVEAIDSLRKVNANIIGSNVTRVPQSNLENKYDYYYYYSYYSTYGKSEK